ncbi:hypothetical protein F4825DRAFT_448547 [Nemania diffusa]|nr:hypothetical protein F4825DRAFT_448547 [Nemania diffusa]
MPDIGLGGTDTSTPLSPSGELLNSDSFVQNLLKGAAGGASTTAYFDHYNAIGQLYKQLMDRGDEAWTEEEDEDGHPLFSVSLAGPKGDSYYLVLRTDGVFTDENGNPQSNGNQIDINGATYNTIGSLTYEIGYNNFTFASTSRKLGILVGSSVAGKLLWPLVKDMAGKVISNIVKGVKGLLTKGGAAAEEVALEAAVNTEIELQEIGVATEGAAGVEAAAASGGLLLGRILVGGAVLLAVALLAASFVLHDSTHVLTVWNLTKYNMEWTIWFDSELGSDEGQLVKAPGARDDDGNIQPSFIAGAAKSKSSLHAKAQPHVYNGPFEVVSSHQYNGIGYALQFSLTDQTDKTQRYAVTVYYDIPFIGDNSHNITFDPVPDVKTWYKNSQGNNKSAHAHATSADGQVVGDSSYDYLSGKHAVPGSQAGGSTNEAYYYQSLLLIQEPNLNVDDIPTVTFTNSG